VLSSVPELLKKEKPSRYKAQAWKLVPEAVVVLLLGRCEMANSNGPCV